MERMSDVALRVEGQPMFKVLDRTKDMKNIIHFELGDPDFATPKHILEATCLSLWRGDTHYTSSMGLINFREAVQEATLRSRGFTPKLEQILVTPGANIITYLAMQTLANPGEEVIIPDPGFPTYAAVAKMLGLVPVAVPVKEALGFRLAPKDVASRLTSKTRLIVLNSPSNPTGAVMTSDEIAEVFHVAQRNGVYLLSDEVYARMIYEKQFFSPSYFDHCSDFVIVMNGFSKAFAMTGFRLGVAIGPPEIIEKMGLLVQTLVSCVPPFVQRAGIAAIRGNQDITTRMMDEYRARRNIIVHNINQIRGLSCRQPDGGFYVFVNIKETGMTSEEFSEKALKAGVALLPGTNFGKYGEGYVRISYATSIENIKEGMRRLENMR